MSLRTFARPDDLRRNFSAAMSAMYRDEVPLYDKLLDLVAETNQTALRRNPDLGERMRRSGEIDRLATERHGAIRVGTANELRLIARAFALMGMHPVNYYDLAAAGVPVHATAFRPITSEALARNPFRIFTSLLRLDVLANDRLREQANAIFVERKIFTTNAQRLIEDSEQLGGVPTDLADEFVLEILETFRWHAEATVDLETYRHLTDEHRLVADVVSFKGPHINHLTPRTLNIDEAQAAMISRGIDAKEVIEGPPLRACPVLLRQTSFKALNEPILFPTMSGEPQADLHSARFGEVEQRGAALKSSGMALYERYLETGIDWLPDDWDELRRGKFAYFRYTANHDANLSKSSRNATLDDLVTNGIVAADPIIYEDFLPVSAAGIFQSNLGSEVRTSYSASAQRAEFERAVGGTIYDAMALYTEAEASSVTRISKLADIASNSLMAE